MPELAELKPGDEVAKRVGMGDYSIHRIVKVSRGIIDLSDGDRYRVSNGSRLNGDKWYRATIEPVTDEIQVDIKRKKLARKLSGLNHNNWEAMDIETLEAVAAIIWKEQPE